MDDTMAIAVVKNPETPVDDALADWEKVMAMEVDDTEAGTSNCANATRSTQ
jgi:hypothetical protein